MLPSEGSADMREYLARMERLLDDIQLEHIEVGCVRVKGRCLLGAWRIFDGKLKIKVHMYFFCEMLCPE